jgi:hypothetical protein
VEKGERRSSSAVIERRTAKRGSEWQPGAFQAPRWCGAARGKGGGPPGAAAWQREKEERGLRAWCSATWGTADAVRAQLTGGARTSQGPSVSGGVGEQEG